MACPVKMTGERNAKKGTDPIFAICFGIFVIAAVIALGAYINNEFISTSDEKASTGDTVTVDYTGTYYDEYGNEKAVVFDTSYSGIGNDDNIAKSNDFKKDSYNSLTFTVGKGTLLEDFEKSVIGHKEGDKYKIVIDAAHAYVGTVTEKELNKTGNSMNTYELLTYNAFHELYPDVDINGKTGMIEFESKYKWKAYATLTDNGKSVAINYMPEVKEYTVYDNGKTTVKYKVTDVTSDDISFDVDIVNPVFVNSDGDIQMIKLDLGEDPIYICNISDNVITYKEGDGVERVNETLYFEIQIVSVKK